ncbi:MAG: glycosyltransferase family 4 protein [Parcubacteria group bacterium]
MRLTYIFNGRLPTEKAHGLQIVKSCEAFAREGIDTMLLVAHRHNLIKEDLFSYYDIERVFDVKNAWGLSLKFLGGNRIGYFIQAFTSDVGILWKILFSVKKNGNIFYARDYPALTLLSFLPYKFIAEIHDYRSARPRWWMRRILKNAHRIVANSEGTLESLEKHYDSFGKKALIVSNGVDVEYFKTFEAKEGIRKRIAMPEEKTILAYIGSLSMIGRGKGVKSILKAFKDIEEANSDAVLYIVGGPDDAVIHYRQEAKEFGLSEDRVVFTGHIAYKDIKDYINAVDIVIMPLPENQHVLTTSPIKLFEYLAAGKVIVAPDISSLHAYINDKNAILFDPDKEDGLQKSLLNAIQDKYAWSKYQENAQKDSINYTWNKRARKIIDFIHE